MKKISEVADELGVTRQTVYNWIDRLDLEDKGYVKVNDDGVKVIDSKGIEEIEEEVEGKVKKKLEKEKEKSEMKKVYEERVKDLKVQNEVLRNQLDKKDELLKEQSIQLENFQHLIANKEKKIYQLEGEVKEQNRSFIDRFKDFFSNNRS